MSPRPTPYQPYGTAIYRRQLSVRIEPGAAVGELIDDYHHFRARVTHAEGRVTDVVGTAPRHPWTTCVDAAQPLRELIGAPLGPSIRSASAHTDSHQQCTHMFDAASIAIARLGRDAGDVVYRVAVPDRVDGCARVTLERDGEPLLAWELDGYTIRAPEPFAGQMLAGGAMADWIEATFDPELAEAALVLQRACVISGGRQTDLESFERADALPVYPAGRCYTYQPANLKRALRMVGSARNLTDVDDIEATSLRAVDHESE